MTAIRIPATDLLAGDIVCVGGDSYIRVEKIEVKGRKVRVFNNNISNGPGAIFGKEEQVKVTVRGTAA